MKTILFFSVLNLWSMANKKGAPSFYNTIKAYVDAGYNVILIMHQKKNVPRQEMEGVSIYTFDNQLFSKLCTIKKISFFGRILFALYCDRMFYKIGNKIVKKYENVLLYSYEVNGVRAAKRLSKKLDVKFISRFQGTVLSQYKNTLLNRLKMYPHFQALETKSDLVIMTDDGTFGDKVLKDLNNQTEKILFLRNGIDISITETVREEDILEIQQKLEFNKNDKILLTVSRLAAWKKVDRAIYAVSKLKISNVKLVIVGDGPERRNLESLVHELGVGDKVIFIGAIAQCDVIKYMYLADIFLSFYDLSNVGNPLLEAMNCGKPIITLNTGNTSALIKNNTNGILLNSEEIELIPEKIEFILKNENIAKELGEKAKEFARENFYSWEKRMDMELKEVAKCFKNDKAYKYNG